MLVPKPVAASAAAAAAAVAADDGEPELGVLEVVESGEEVAELVAEVSEVVSPALAG